MGCDFCVGSLRLIHVLSGMVASIDTSVHTSALDAGGCAVAVMGAGLGCTCPSTNKNLRERVIANRGLAMTQFEPNAAVKPTNFPMRNAVMSGYGVTTFVVAASAHSSTCSQVKNAVKHGLGLVALVPLAPGAPPGGECLGDLPVGEGVPVPVEVCLRAPGARVVREPTMKPTPASSRAFRLAVDSLPALGGRGQGLDLGGLADLFNGADDRGGLGPVALPATDSQGEAGPVDQQADDDLGVSPTLFDSHRPCAGRPPSRSRSGAW